MSLRGIEAETDQSKISEGFPLIDEANQIFFIGRLHAIFLLFRRFTGFSLESIQAWTRATA